MPYHDQAALEARFTPERIAELFSAQNPDGSSTGAVNAGALAAAIADTDAEIDSILGAVFDVPFTAPIDPLITALACDMTPWMGMRRRPEFLTNPAMKPYKDLYDDAVKILREIRDGKRIVSASKRAANVGGEIVSDNPVDASPFYFIPDRSTGEGGFGSAV